MITLHVQILKTLYLSNSIEQTIFIIYHSIGISTPSQILNDNVIEKISKKLDIKTYYFDESSEANNIDGCYRIFINQNQSQSLTLSDFASGLAHLINHERYLFSALNPFYILEEWSAEIFASHICIPTFMLNKLKMPLKRYEAVRLIATLFNVEHTFASARLETWLQN